MNTTQTSRRDFLKTSIVASTVIAAPGFLTTTNATGKSGPLKVGLIGCGGRGTGAANQALSADKDAILTALGDAFPEPLQSSLDGLKKRHGDRVKVSPETSFVGLDAYQKVIDSGVDVVLLAAPPGFRPVHFKAAVDANKHIFCEKPVATDAHGVRMMMEAVKASKAKEISVVSGFCWRYDLARREFFKKIHEGAIGDIRAIYATYYAGSVKPMPPESDRKGMKDLEWQMRNWYNFTWLSGDGLVEQACHSIDKISWGMKDKPPVKAVAVGGRQTPNNQGNIFDHMFVVYEYEDGARAFMGQRQIGNTFSENSDYLMGSAGTGRIAGWGAPVITGKERWRYSGEKADMYQREHDELFASIRAGKWMNDGDWMTQSTLMALMGRMAAYTGQEVTWEQALNSKEQLVPEKLDWDMTLPIKPMAIPGTDRIV